MPALLELERLACERGGRRLFGGLSLVLHAGDLLRVHGANGSGKTSLLRLLCGL
jgi:heme exporter protein A